VYLPSGLEIFRLNSSERAGPSDAGKPDVAELVSFARIHVEGAKRRFPFAIRGATRLPIARYISGVDDFENFDCAAYAHGGGRLGLIPDFDVGNTHLWLL